MGGKEKYSTQSIQTSIFKVYGVVFTECFELHCKIFITCWFKTCLKKVAWRFQEWGQHEEFSRHMHWVITESKLMCQIVNPKNINNISLLYFHYNMVFTTKICHFYNTWIFSFYQTDTKLQTHKLIATAFELLILFTTILDDFGSINE